MSRVPLKIVDLNLCPAIGGAVIGIIIVEVRP